MKETILSTCEKNFILQAASESKRLDGRKLDEFRDLNLYFGTDWGLCYASLGETKVIAQVSCEIQQPKTVRPNEGLLFINVELSSMAAPFLESGRGSDLCNHLNRLLEKCIKDSKAVDLESLCLVAEEKVWALRVDVNILNHDGNLITCASVSALAALAHFKRPDVTTDGQEIIIHTINERDPIPITLHHFPVCINFALLNNGMNILADPTSMEERVSDASLIFAINSYGEICGLHLGGNALVLPNLIIICSRKSATKSKQIVNMIKEALTKDAKARLRKESFGLVECIPWDKMKSMSNARLKIQLNKFTLNETNKENEDNSFEELSNESNAEVINLNDNCAELVHIQRSKLESKDSLDDTDHEIFVMSTSSNHCLRGKNVKDNFLDNKAFGEGGPSKWNVDTRNRTSDCEDSDSTKSDNEIDIIPIPSKEIESIDLSGDSEEEALVMHSHDLENPVKVNLEKIKKKSSLPPKKTKLIHPSTSSGFKNNKKRKRKLIEKQ